MTAPNEVLLTGSSEAEIVANLEMIHGPTTGQRNGHGKSKDVFFADGAAFSLRQLHGHGGPLYGVQPLLPPQHPKAPAAGPATPRGTSGGSPWQRLTIPVAA